jgi:hypothetical protein
MTGTTFESAHPDDACKELDIALLGVNKVVEGVCLLWLSLWLSRTKGHWRGGSHGCSQGTWEAWTGK